MESCLSTNQVFACSTIVLVSYYFVLFYFILVMLFVFMLLADKLYPKSMELKKIYVPQY